MQHSKRKSSRASTSEQYMASQHAINIVWTVKKASEFVQYHGNNLRLAKCFLHLHCLDAKEWEAMLSMDSEGLQVHLCRSMTDEGPDEVEAGFYFGLLKGGEDWNHLGERKTMAFKRDSSCVAKMTVARWGELLRVTNQLIVDDCVRISIRLWTLSQRLTNPVTFYAHSLSVGVQRTVTCEVDLLSSMKSRKLGICPVGTMRPDDSDLKVQLCLHDKKVCVQFTCAYVNYCVLLESVRIVRRDQKAELIYKSKELLRCDKPDTDKALAQSFPFVNVRKITDNKSLYLPNKRLTLILSLTDYTNYSICHVKNFGAKVRASRLSPIPQISPYSGGNYFDHLSRGLGDMLKEGIYSDLTLKVEEKSIAVHKIILSAGSPVFKSMIHSRESATLEVPDFQSGTVFLLVRYLYTGSVPDLNPSEALELYSAAEKYGVAPLHDHCRNVLESSLSPQTVCRVLCLSDGQSDQGLKDSVLSYIRANEKEVFSSAEWRSFMRDDPVRALEVSQHCHAKRLKLSR